MSKEARTPMTLELVKKGQGAIPEPIPEAPRRPEPVLEVASAPPREPMTAFTVRMPEALSERIRLLSIRTRRGKGDLVVEALTRFLDGAGV
jgi:hypothetical protein